MTRKVITLQLLILSWVIPCSVFAFDPPTQKDPLAGCVVPRSECQGGISAWLESRAALGQIVSHSVCFKDERGLIKSIIVETLEHAERIVQRYAFRDLVKYAVEPV